ncbi:hypothetical protein GBAR_LOCUS4508 [Geodia barretti]|uniref:Uncharacterized protein n=1 Tax=Geodia barretti TaxID=519541 RepID=A0AA35R704_GEOBA|nr:hypothetical protein GBAR_LOCUS4508 [Geodia barretti]
MLAVTMVPRRSEMVSRDGGRTLSPLLCMVQAPFPKLIVTPMPLLSLSLHVFLTVSYSEYCCSSRLCEIRTENYPVRAIRKAAESQS